MLIWYDPVDPGDILVYGRRDVFLEAAFILLGSVFILAGAGLAAFGG